LSQNVDVEVVASAIQEIRAGNHRAYRHIVNCYQRRLFGLALMMTRDVAAAEEVTQDAFVRAFANLDHYDTDRSFYPWVSAIAVRLAQDWLRSRGKKFAREVSELSGADRGFHDSPLDRLIAEEGERSLWEQVAGLSSGERTVVLMYYRDEVKVNDIARSLGVAPGTVKTLLFRARKRLRLAMSRSAHG